MQLGHVIRDAYKEARATSEARAMADRGLSCACLRLPSGEQEAGETWAARVITPCPADEVVADLAVEAVLARLAPRDRAAARVAMAAGKTVPAPILRRILRQLPPERTVRALLQGTEAPCGARSPTGGLCQRYPVLASAPAAVRRLLEAWPTGAWYAGWQIDLRLVSAAIAQRDMPGIANHQEVFDRVAWVLAHPASAPGLGA